MYKFIFFIGIMSCLFLPSISFANDNIVEPIPISVSILPQKFIVNSIAGNLVQIEVMVPQNKDPHDYEPSPVQIVQLYRSKMYFEIGMPFEQIFLDKIKKLSKHTKFVSMIENCKPLIIKHHGITIIDPHIWMSPIELKIMCKNTLKALTVLLPQQKEILKNNYENLIKKIEQTDQVLQKKLKPYKDRTFFVFHPAFGYFANAFNLKEDTIEVEGKSPTPREVLEIIEKANELQIKTVFVEPQFSRTSAQTVANAIHANIEMLNPLAENILTNYIQICDKIIKSFSKQK